MENIKLEMKNIYKRYPNANFDSITDLNLQVKEGEFIALVGPSGCGKSTTLRMIAGLETISQGEFLIDDKVMNEVEPKDRGLAMVFQNYALYPHMSIYDNMAYGLKVKKIPKAEIEKKVHWAAEVLELKDHLDKKPSGLSGGQRQRVALGRCMVRDVNLFLMDEPLSNLDAKLRVSMRNEIKSLHDQLGTTTIYVTHDQVEAMTMADRIVLMKDGIVQQVGKPLELYHDPKNKFVAEFIGSPQMNVLKVNVTKEAIVFEDGLTLPIGEKKILPNGMEAGEYYIGFRPEHVSTERIVSEGFPEWKIKQKIRFIEKLGNDNYIYSNIGSEETRYRIAANRMGDEDIGTELELVLNLSKAIFFDVETEERIK